MKTHYFITSIVLFIFWFAFGIIALGSAGCSGDVYTLAPEVDTFTVYEAEQPNFERFTGSIYEPGIWYRDCGDLMLTQNGQVIPYVMDKSNIRNVTVSFTADTRYVLYASWVWEVEIDHWITTAEMTTPYHYEATRDVIGTKFYILGIDSLVFGGPTEGFYTRDTLQIK